MMRAARDANAKADCNGIATASGKIKELEARIIYIPPVANAALMNDASRPPTVTTSNSSSM